MKTPRILALLLVLSFAAGLVRAQEYNKPAATTQTEVVIGCHSTGNTERGAEWRAPVNERILLIKD